MAMSKLQRSLPVAQGVLALLLLALGISIGDARLIWAPHRLFVILVILPHGLFLDKCSKYRAARPGPILLL